MDKNFLQTGLQEISYKLVYRKFHTKLTSNSDKCHLHVKSTCFFLINNDSPLLIDITFHHLAYVASWSFFFIFLIKKKLVSHYLLSFKNKMRWGTSCHICNVVKSAIFGWWCIITLL
jgi:hypothetical protein